jgi:hypothetical protein
MARYPAGYPPPASWRAGIQEAVSRCLSTTGVRFSVILCPARDWALLTVGLPASGRTSTGFPRSARTSCDREGRPLYPGDDGAHPDRWRLPAGVCRFAAARPCTPLQLPSLRGLRLTRSQRGFKPFARPVFPSLWPPGRNGPPLDSSLGLRTPPTQSRTTHAEVGTGHRARTWNYRSTHIFCRSPIR